MFRSFDHPSSRGRARQLASFVLKGDRFGDVYSCGVGGNSCNHWFTNNINFGRYLMADSLQSQLAKPPLSKLIIGLSDF